MKTKIPGLTFSWKRALGITQMKRKIGNADPIIEALGIGNI